MRVVSLPSEYAPAPPSPNWILQSGSSAAAPERIYRPVALVHIAAALEYDRTEAVPGERVRREQSGRAETHDDRTVRKALFAVRNGRPCIFFITHRRHLQLFRKCLLVAGCVQTHRIYAGDLAAARVDADAAHRSLGLRRQQSGQTAGPVERRRLRLVKRQPDAGHKQAHSLSSPFSPVQSEEPLSAPPEPSPVI